MFCRFAGCNLWTGREEDRATAVCQFCDTDFVGTDGPGGGKFRDADDLADAVAARVAGDGPTADRFVVCTGGEPLLQLDDALVDALHARGLRDRHRDQRHAAGRRPGIDWICVSPKAGADLVLTRGDELKLVYPQAGRRARALRAICDFDALLPPADGRPRPRRNTATPSPTASPIRAGG